MYFQKIWKNLIAKWEYSCSGLFSHQLQHAYADQDSDHLVNATIYKYTLVTYTLLWKIYKSSVVNKLIPAHFNNDNHH